MEQNDTVKDERRSIIHTTARDILEIIGQTPNVDDMEQAKLKLLELAKKIELFPEDDFPLPDNGALERTFLLYKDETGAALYAIKSLPGMQYGPHDHGGSWALIAAISGQERHYLYEDITKPSETENAFQLALKGDIICQPGTAISMLPTGIHAIESVNSEPLFMLHFYGLDFTEQTDRKDYDMQTARIKRNAVSDFGLIEDRR